MVVRTVSYDGRISRESRYWIHYSREFVENTEAKQHIPGIPTPRGSGNLWRVGGRMLRARDGTTGDMMSLIGARERIDLLLDL